VESLAYSRELRRGLLSIASSWKAHLSADGQKRLKRLSAAQEDESPAAQADLLDELTRLERLGYLQGWGEAERGAILDWRRGQLAYARGQYPEALAAYERAERALPEGCEALKKLLGEALYDLAGKLMWPEDTGSAIYSPEAERILPKVVAWLPEKQGAWYRLGAILNLAGRNDEAIAAYQRAIQLDPKFAYPHNGLGNVYSDLGNYDDAIAAYQRAIQLDPKFAAPHNGLGVVYQLLGQYEKALSVYQKAVELAPDRGTYRGSLVGILRKLGREAEAQVQIEIARSLMAKENEYNRACFESICGNVEQALALLKVALEKKQTSLEWVRRDPDFDSIREEPGFKALVGL
jgi:tetratricopeptide (TPR) repeat protein